MSGARQTLPMVLALSIGLTAAPSVAAGRLPGWLTVADLARAPAVDVPAVPKRQLAALKSDKHGFVERLRRHEIDLRADGSVEDRMVVARQFLNEDGIRNAGTLSLYARPDTDRMVIEAAYVLLPDGRRLPFQSRLLQIRNDRTADLFSDLQEISLPFSGLEVGATAVVSYRRLRALDRWPLPWSEILPTQGMVATGRLEISVHWPRGNPPPLHRTDDTALQCQRSAQSLRCQRDGIAAIASDPDVSDWPDLVPHLALARDDRWETLVEAERQALDPPGDHPAISSLARRLARGTRSTGEVMERLFRFTADEIRYVGFEHGHGAVVPRPPAVTLERRFGDCKDKVALFLALARAAKVPAFPVLMATDRRNARKLLLPSWKYFDHVVACAVDEKGTTCFDPTDPHLPAGVMSLPVRDKVALPVRPGGRPGALPDAARRAKYGWMIEVESKNAIECDGSVVEEVNRTYLGAGAGQMRNRLRSQTAAERRRWLETSYAGVMGDKIKPTEVAVHGLEDPRSPLVLRTVTRYPGSSTAKAWKDYREADHWMSGIGVDFRTENRHHPLATVGLSLRSRASFTMCSDVRPKLPGARLDLRGPFGELTRRYSVHGQRVDVDTRLVLEPGTYPTEKLADWNRFLDGALGETRIWFSLEPAEVPVD